MTTAEPGLLSRFRVLDLTRIRSGPTCVKQFADWGADVIRIEPPGDTSGYSDRESSDFLNLHSNKRSLTLDLKQPEGREILNQLMAKSDILVENFRPGVKKRLGLDWETVHARHPHLVLGSISGFGQTGPYAERPGFDQVAQGMGGLMSVTGLPGQGPVRAGIAIADVASGLYCALGIMVALLDREKTGRGKWVQSSLLQAQVALLDFQAARWLIDGQVPEQAGNDHPTAVPMGLYPTADGPMNIAVTGEHMWAAFCRVIGREDLVDDPRFAGGKQRRVHKEELNTIVRALTAVRGREELSEALLAAGIPCGPVNTIDQVFADPQVQHLGIVGEVQHPRRGPLKVLTHPAVISGTHPTLDRAAPDAGEDSDAVLAELGFDEHAISGLRQRKII